MSWFRFYDEVVDDPKVQRLPLLLFRAWVNCLCITKKHGGVLPEMRDVAYRLHVTESRAETIVKQLIDAGLFDRKEGSIEPHNWGRRQFQSDVSTDRVKRFRNGQRNVSETVNETDQNRTDTETESETDTEQNPPAFAVTDLDFQDIWRKHPNPKGRKEALCHFKASVKTPEDLADIQRALESYRNQRLSENARRRERGTDEIPWQNGSTWFNNWRDWIPEDFEQPDEIHPSHLCELCDTGHMWVCDSPEDCTLSVGAACPEFHANHQQRIGAKA